MILAGGEGNRLYPLTQHRAKPAVPFGGKYRLIDFVLSNFLNSSIYSLYILTQFKSQSLTEHINETWRIGSVIRDHFILPVPAQKRTGDSWYQGTADAIYQNIILIEDGDFDLIAVFGADHIYKMDLQQMIDFHIKKKADVTVSAIPVPIGDATSFGVIQVQEKYRIIGFQEKPKRPKPIPGREKEAFASMGNYLFNKDFLIDILYKDAEDKNSSHDFGKDILPNMLDDGKTLYAYPFDGYWKDVGTIQSLWEANMDLLSEKPKLDLNDPLWRIYTRNPNQPAEYISPTAVVRNSMINEGCTVCGEVEHSVLFYGVEIGEGSVITDSVIMPKVRIGSHVRIHRAIVTEDMVIEDHTTIGPSPEDPSQIVLVSGNDEDVLKLLQSSSSHINQG